MMTISRAERRAEAAKQRGRIDAACPKELTRAVDVAIATSIAGKRLEFRPGDTVAKVLTSKVPQAFAAVEAEGFKLSFDLPDNTKERLSRGMIVYAIKRQSLN